MNTIMSGENFYDFLIMVLIKVVEEEARMRGILLKFSISKTSRES